MTLKEINSYLPSIKWDIKEFFRLFTSLFTFYLRAIELGDVENQSYGFYPSTARFDMLTRYGDMIEVNSECHPFLDLNDLNAAHRVDGLRAVVKTFDDKSYPVTLFVPPFIFSHELDATLESLMYKRVHTDGDLEYGLLHQLLDRPNVDGIEITE